MRRLPAEASAPELSALVATLADTEARLEEMTAGEVDTVTDTNGRTFFLRRAQDQLRFREAAKQTAILNALPAHVCLLDQNGLIISTNDAWSHFAEENTHDVCRCGVGINYLEICDAAKGLYAFGAETVAAGIRSVLSGQTPSFTMEYPCDSPTESRWFLLTVTPLLDGTPPSGAAIMHVNITDRKRSEVALHEMAKRTERNEKLLNSALSSMSDFAQIYDRQGHVLYANQPCLDLWATTLEDAVGKDFLELGYNPVLALQLQSQVAQVFETGCRIVDETAYTNPDGKPGYYEYILSPILAADGQVDFVVGSTRDVTERKSAAKELRDSEVSMVMAQRVGNFGSWELDLRNLSRTGPTVARWSDEMCRIAGFEPGVTVATDEMFFSMVPEEEHGLVKNAVETAIISKLPLSFDHRFKRADGEMRLLHVSVQVFYDDVTGEPIKVVGTAHDITERKQAELALIESEERFRNMLENVQLLAKTVDLQGNITFCNDYLLRLTGWDRESVLNSNWFDLFIPESDRAKRSSIFQAIPTQGVEPHHEGRIITRSGETREVVWNNTALRDGSGRLVGVACIGEDVTERKSLQEQLLQSQKMESLGSLAGGIAHDFNNLLTGMLGYAELAQLRLPKDSPVQTDLEEIRLSAERAAKLTKQLLSFARKEVVAPQVVDLSELVIGLENLIRRLLGAGIDLVVRSRPGLGRVQLDPSQFEQVIVNLSVNARDAMPKGGTLIIATSDAKIEQVQEVRGGMLQPGDYVLLSVTDTGCGMPKEVQARAFDPFFTTKEKGRGTGLGLSTCYGIITNSGGYILTSSELNFGTTFDIYLPRVAAPLTLVETAEQQIAYGDGETILIVEDESTVRSLVVEILTGLDYNVLKASTGRAALEVIAAYGKPIDLVLSDVVMPGMTGPDLAEILEFTHPQIKVLFMSGFTDTTTLLPNTFLQKPFSPTQLARKVREVFDQAAQS